MVIAPTRLALVGVAAAITVAAGAVVLTRPSALSPVPEATPVAQSLPAPTPVPAAPAAPSFDVVRVSPAGGAVFAGRAEPLAAVSIRDNGQEIGQVHADSRGEWVFLPSGPLAPGAQQLTLAAIASSGAESRSEGEVLLVVPDRAASSPAPALAVLTTPEAPSRVLQSAPPPGRVSLDVVDYDTQGQIRFTGAGPASAPMRVYVDNAAVGDARTDGQGHWTLEPGAAVKPGVHAARVDQLGPKGQVVSRVEMPFQRADMPALEPGRVVVQPGQNLWRLARAAYGAGIRYMVIYQANQDQIRDPRRIYPGQAFSIPGGS